MAIHVGHDNVQKKKKSRGMGTGQTTVNTNFSKWAKQPGHHLAWLICSLSSEPVTKPACNRAPKSSLKYIIYIYILVFALKRRLVVMERYSSPWVARNCPH